MNKGTGFQKGGLCDAPNNGKMWRAEYDQACRRKRRNEKISGFVTGCEVTVVSTVSGNLIVNVKDSRVALGKDMANKILV